MWQSSCALRPSKFVAPPPWLIPRPRWTKGFKGLPFGPAALDLRDDMDAFDTSLRILSPPIFLERLHHVPYREQGDDNSIERLHLHARLVRRFDARRHDDSVRSHVERDARGGNRNRMGVREDLPDRLHRLKRGDLGGRERVAFLDVLRTNRTDRRRLETDQPGSHGAAAHVRLPPDVDHLRHCERGRLPRYFIVRSLSMQPRLSGEQMSDCHARARDLCQVSVSDAKRVIYDAGAFCGRRADGMRARRDGKGDRLAGSWTRSSGRAIATCATRHAKEKRRGET